MSLSAAIAKLADTQANGGAGLTFNASSPANATVTVNAEDEVSFAISDATGRSVMNGKLDNYKGTEKRKGARNRFSQFGDLCTLDLICT